MWKTIPVDDNYEASTEGQIREKTTHKILSQWRDKDGYLLVSLSKKMYRAHRIIAMTFIDNPKNKPVVNHKDFNKTNNHIENLEWVSHSENSQHSFTGHHRDASIKSWVKKVQPLAAEASKTKVAQYDLEGNLLAIFPSQREASEATNTCRSSITRCVRGDRKTAGGYKWAYFLESSTTKTEEKPASAAQDSQKPPKGEDIV